MTEYRIEHTIIRSSNPEYERLRGLCHEAKNLWNKALYDLRQAYVFLGVRLTWQDLKKHYGKTKQPDYTALPRKVSTQTLMELGYSFKSFYALNEKWKKGKRKGSKPRIPGYRPKDGYATVYYPSDTISKNVIEIKPGLFKHTVCPCNPHAMLEVYSKHKHLVMVKIVPRNGFIDVQAVREHEVPEPVPDDGVVAGMDPGVGNFMTVAFTDGSTPVILPGGPIKAVNQYANKQAAKCQSLMDKYSCKKGEKKNGTVRKSSKRIRRIWLKRNLKLDWIFNNYARMLTNLIASRGVTLLVVGRNKGWKQDVRLGRKVNQEFVSIPFDKFYRILEDKLKDAGIRVVFTEESYTSVASFFDKDELKAGVYSGSRVKRGLYKTSTGVLVNADVNGALNITRKVISNVRAYAHLEEVMAVAVRPVKLRFPKLVLV